LVNLPDRGFRTDNNTKSPFQKEYAGKKIFSSRLLTHKRCTKTNRRAAAHFSKMRSSIIWRPIARIGKQIAGDFPDSGKRWGHVLMSQSVRNAVLICSLIRRSAYAVLMNWWSSF